MAVSEVHFQPAAERRRAQDFHAGLVTGFGATYYHRDHPGRPQHEIAVERQNARQGRIGVICRTEPRGGDGHGGEKRGVIPYSLFALRGCFGPAKRRNTAAIRTEPAQLDDAIQCQLFTAGRWLEVQVGRVERLPGHQLLRLNPLPQRGLLRGPNLGAHRLFVREPDRPQTRQTEHRHHRPKPPPPSQDPFSAAQPPNRTSRLDQEQFVAQFLGRSMPVGGGRRAGAQDRLVQIGKLFRLGPALPTRWQIGKIGLTGNAPRRRNTSLKVSGTYPFVTQSR